MLRWRADILGTIYAGVLHDVGFKVMGWHIRNSIQAFLMMLGSVFRWRPEILGTNKYAFLTFTTFLRALPRFMDPANFGFGWLSLAVFHWVVSHFLARINWRLELYRRSFKLEDSFNPFIYQGNFLFLCWGLGKLWKRCFLSIIIDCTRKKKNQKQKGKRKNAEG